MNKYFREFHTVAKSTYPRATLNREFSTDYWKSHIRHLKRCSVCGLEKEAKNMVERKLSADKLATICKECQKERNHLYYLKNKRQLIAYAANYYKNNKKHLNEVKREHRLIWMQDPEYKKMVNDRDNSYRKKRRRNPETREDFLKRCAGYMRNWRLKHHTHWLEYTRRYYKKHYAVGIKDNPET